MIGFILRLITSGLWRPIAAVLGAIGVYLAGRRGAAQKAEKKAMRIDLDAHERLNDADLGHGATDDERIKRLRQFADKHGD